MTAAPTETTRPEPEISVAAHREHPERSSRPTRVALVGAGFIADFHAEILRGTPDVELAAVCDPDLARAESLARKWNVARAVRTVAELRGLSIDVAHVLVPPNLHTAVAKELLDAGIGVFVEKPLALSTADARELDRIARERGLVLGVNHNAVHHPAFAKLLERVRAGEIGRVEHVRVCLSVPLRQLDAGDFSAWMFREPRNIVFEQAPHPFAQIVELAGAPREVETHVLASRELQPGQTFHERWVISGTAEHGTVEVFLHFGASFTRWTLEVLGSDGSLEADLFHNHLAGERKTLYLDFWNSFLAGWRRGKGLERSARRVLTDYLKLTLGFGARQDAFFAGMRSSVRAFHAALRAGAPPPIDAARGALVLEWCERATAHVAAGRAQAIELPAPGKARTGEVVVLGATGFIGKRVLAKLLERGAPVTAVVRRTHSLPPQLIDAARRGDVRLVRASLEDPAALATALQGAKCVLQLATGNANNWEGVQRAMVRGSVAIAQACIDAKVERYVFCSSTAALYLGPDAHPQPVEDSLECDPEPDQRSLYARGKIATERELVRLAHERRLPLVIVRPGVVLGRGTAMQHSGLGLWARDNHCVGWGRGDNALPLVWVDDVADALVAIAMHGGRELDGKALNLAANTGLSAAEVVAELRSASGRDLQFHPRALELSQAMEFGKWLVKRAGGRSDAAFPSWRDLKSRSLAAPLSCRTARTVLGWKPVEDRERFLALAVRSMVDRER